MATLSVIIITFNEAKNIENCLNSVKDLADEILILDSISTDETKKLISQYPFPIRFFESEFEGYGRSKNKLSEWAKGDFVFSIDADEVVSEKLKISILREKSLGFPSLVYDMRRLNIYCGKAIRFGGWNPDIKSRIWKSGCARWDLSEVHEKLIVDGNQSGKLLAGELIHYSYRTREEHLAKLIKYAQRGAVDLNRAGKRGSYLKLFLSPVFRFFRDYLLKMGFLDGYEGLQIAFLTAKEVYLKYRKLLNLQNQTW